MRRFAVLTLAALTLLGFSAAANALIQIDPMTGKPLETHTSGHHSNPMARHLPREITVYHGDEAPGTVVVDTTARRLYYVMEGGLAMTYGIGVARPGFEWAGTHRVSMKREWPDWTPPAEMRKRQPDLPAFMPGGPENPLGARALYLGSSLYRIHGSSEPWSIGEAVSSGCIRMLNDDVVDLYERVKVGAAVVVR